VTHSFCVILKTSDTALIHYQSSFFDAANYMAGSGHLKVEGKGTNSAVWTQPSHFQVQGNGRNSVHSVAEAGPSSGRRK
jgi:hypothetical protein